MTREKITPTLLSWASILEPNTRDQAVRTASMPFVFPHVLARLEPARAGRQHSRAAARRTFTHDQLREAMVGIEFRDTDAFLDEIPGAYKDIDQVMSNAADLVEVRHVLHQLVNVKGD